MPDRRAVGGSGKAAASRDVARPALRAQGLSMRHGRARGNVHEQRTRLRTCANLPCPSSIAVIAMPSFDIVSEVDTHELTNAVDQANRELSTRFDFKGVEASFERDENLITQAAPSEFQLQQMTDILQIGRAHV